MNSCILMAQIVRSPELRYTQDNQIPIAQMLVEFPGLRSEDPPATLKVVGWRNLALEINDNYSEGDRVILEGRLSMNIFERQEGFKEKRAEFVASRIHRVGDSSHAQTSSPPASNFRTDNVVPLDSYKQTTSNVREADVGVSVTSSTPETATIPLNNVPKQTDPDKNLDDIPF
ncbi:MAG: single-stranded DNA-binding protein [Moorea sp. SIO2B7]|nr:single-stranded DNA-binding protein [Moorena sp. SIO2B7]